MKSILKVLFIVSFVLTPAGGGWFRPEFSSQLEAAPPVGAGGNGGTGIGIGIGQGGRGGQGGAGGQGGIGLGGNSESISGSQSNNSIYWDGGSTYYPAIPQPPDHSGEKRFNIFDWDMYYWQLSHPRG